MKSATFLHTTDNHTCQRTDFAVWIFLDHFLQTFHTAVAITSVQKAQTVDEDELRTVCTQWETAFRQFGVCADDICAVSLEGLVGGCVERILQMFAELGILNIIRIS